MGADATAPVQRCWCGAKALPHHAFLPIDETHLAKEGEAVVPVDSTGGQAREPMPILLHLDAPLREDEEAIGQLAIIDDDVTNMLKVTEAHERLHLPHHVLINAIKDFHEVSTGNPKLFDDIDMKKLDRPVQALTSSVDSLKSERTRKREHYNMKNQ